MKKINKNIIRPERDKIIYADTTASGEFYRPIENVLMEEVYPYYANTHSNSRCGRYMAHLINETREYIRKTINAPEDAYEIIFTGNGCTGAISHLIHHMGFIKKPEFKTTTFKLMKPPKEYNIIVFVSAMEHYSNYLPWLHLLDPKGKPIRVEIIKANKSTGEISTNDLMSKFKKYKNTPVKICSFSACSNITGTLQNVKKIYDIVKERGGVMFWDYAASGPYVKIDSRLSDGLFLSGHKFLGVASVGLLVIKKALCINKTPHDMGGGTPRFVCTKCHTFSNKKQSGGTPNIIGIIKLGLCFYIKNLHFKLISRREKEIVGYINDKLKKIKKIKYFCLNTNRLPIYTIQVLKENGGIYHYNYIVALLDRFYGIQTRGGVHCSIAVETLLSLNRNKSDSIHKYIISGKGVPAEYGYIRISFTWYMEQFKINYILKAIREIANKYAKKEYPNYEYSPEKNLWFYKGAEEQYPNLYKKLKE